MKTLIKKQKTEKIELTTQELLEKSIQARMMLFLEHIGKLEQFKLKMM